MRAVVQRVTFSRVVSEGVESGKIEKGFNVLLGVSTEDADVDCGYICDKIANLRVFEDEDGKLNLSILEKLKNGENYGVLLVSQFTLYGDCRKGRRPSFVEAARPEQAEILYEKVKAGLEAYGLKVETGVFRTDMKVEIVNDGPVTLLLDSKKGF
ncbi:MAG: D-tyrosyl-tRNA(Tyr) deacylase [Ruminococcaceae bacterium]|nr:D-tyrosyl-tRNA(Tyr) deacylase [Oscillospiraceae bacterium]